MLVYSNKAYLSLKINQMEIGKAESEPKSEQKMQNEK